MPCLVTLPVQWEDPAPPPELHRALHTNLYAWFAAAGPDLTDAAGLTPEEWQTAPLLVNPPGYAPAAVALLAELHGRMGYFPTLVCIRRVESAVPPRYEVAELLDLQAVRDRARLRRAQSSRQQRQVRAKPDTDEKGHDA